MCVNWSNEVDGSTWLNVSNGDAPIGRTGVGAIETLTPGPRHPSNMTDTSDAEDAVDPDEVRHVAELARVNLTDEEAASFAAQFSEVLSHFEALDEVPEVGDEPDLVNVMRADEVDDGLTQEEALANAPESEEGYFKGPKVS